MQSLAKRCSAKVAPRGAGLNAKIYND